MTVTFRPSSYSTKRVFSLLILLIAFYVQPVLSTTSINAYTDATCRFAPRPPQVGPPTGFCQTIVTPNAISVDIQELDMGCTVTIYSDPYCTDNMLEIIPGDCGNLNGTTIRSFSIDECPPGTIDTTIASNSTATGTSSTTIPTSTSSGYTPNMRNTSSTNKTAIIAGATGGGIVLILITIGIIAYFYRKDRNAKRQIDYATDNFVGPVGGVGGVGSIGGGGGGGASGGYDTTNTSTTIAPDAPAGYTGLGPYSTHYPPVGELEGHPAFWRYGTKYAAPVGPSGSGHFETQAAEGIPMPNIPRQELAASSTLRVTRQDRDNLPDMPRIPGPYA
ncbi:hypothetical protein TWF694_010106 [Orbilia ellipsospora]|uniref:Uncharacterized protein n=1 Tax=Orbilia ellipsospora TaxID=2528407 RepID=A0AAV9XA71_9PEZI